jgi:hypothetical protein
MTVSLSRTVRFTPPGEQGESPPVYVITAPTLMQRAAFRRDVAAAGARYPGQDEMFRALREGIRAAVEEDAQPALLEKLDAAEAAGSGLAEDAELARDLAEIETAMRRHHPPYAALEAERAYWLSIAPIVAARHFLRGWEGVEAPFRRQNGLVPEDLLAQLPDATVEAIGWEAIALMSPSRVQAKNSASPSPSPSDPATSPAEPSPPTAVPDGSSSASASAGTPG